MSDVVVEDIMKAADWSNKGVFRSFTTGHSTVDFGLSVLAAGASKSHVDIKPELSK